jgi:formylglycine-generating enzyme required for sulfatase activity
MSSGEPDALGQMPKLLQRWMQEALHNRIVVNAKDGSVLVYVPEGEFEMGDGKDSDSPKHRVFLSAYWVGIYCVTNAQYLKFVQATGYRTPNQKILCTPVWEGRKLPPDQADHPVVCVGWDDAQAYAEWAGCRLPTEAQWEKAARGPQGLIYPWGNDWDSSRCRRHLNRGNEATCRVYDYPAGISGYGTYNQSGNVWEWCRDWYDKDYYGRAGKLPIRDPHGPDGGIYRVIRGGSWWYDDAGYFRATYRYWNDPGYRRDCLGFRLIRSAA